MPRDAQAAHLRRQYARQARAPVSRHGKLSSSHRLVSAADISEFNRLQVFQTLMVAKRRAAILCARACADRRSQASIKFEATIISALRSDCRLLRLASAF